MPGIDKVVLLSGGLDSSVALASAVYSTQAGASGVAAVSFDYGQRHGKLELACAVKQAERYGVSHVVVPVMPVFASSALTDARKALPDAHFEDPVQQITVVPGRNLVFISLAAALAEAWGAGWLWIGAHVGDRAIYQDCRPEFIEAANHALRLSGLKVRVLAPFLGKTKVEIVALGRELGVDFGNTHSCYEGLLEPCGKCGACRERQLAFDEVGGG